MHLCSPTISVDILSINIGCFFFIAVDDGRIIGHLYDRFLNYFRIYIYLVDIIQNFYKYRLLDPIKSLCRKMAYSLLSWAALFFEVIGKK
jgi:hypothetical protein